MSEEVQNQNNQNLIAEIRGRIQFIITIAIFFVAAIYYFYNIYDKNDANSVALSSTLFVVFYLIFYISFESRGKMINLKYLKLINTLILMGAGIFLVPLIFLGMTAAPQKGLTAFILIMFVKLQLFTISLWALAIFPLAILILLEVFSFLAFFEKKKKLKIFHNKN